MMNQPQQPQQKGWFSRNLKWILPVGCLGVILIGVVFILAIVLFVFGAMKSSDVYQEAVRRAQADPVVTSELGQPVEAGWFLSGSINVSDAGGEADLRIPISGPKGSGTIHAKADKRGSRWVYDTLEVEIEGRSERVNLLGP